MAAPKTVSGARAKVSIIDANGPRVVGIFANVSYNLTYDAQPAYILGRYSATEIDYTAVDIVHITASGWRVVGHGWHKGGALPKVEDLMFAEYITMTVTDRQTEATKSGNPVMATIKNVRPTSASGGFAARQLSESTYTYVGILVDDEDTVNDEGVGAVNLP